MVEGFTPPPVPPPVTNPLQWQIGHAQAADGSKVCVLILQQGLLTTQVTLNPHDTDVLGDQLKAAATQARSALIIPTAALPNLGLNGSH